MDEFERERRGTADNGVRLIPREQQTAGTVLTGVMLLLAADPQVRAMFEANDRERFIEGCQTDPSFAQKFGRALLTIREMAAAQ